MLDKPEFINHASTYAAGLPLVAFSWLSDPDEVQAVAALIGSLALAAKVVYDIMRKKNK